MRKLSLPSFSASNNGNFLRLKALKTAALTFLLGSISYTGFAAITVTNTGSATPCANTAANGITPAYTGVGNIVVREGVGTPGDFAMGTDQIKITTPAGWSFNTGATITVVSTGSPTDFSSYSIGTFTSTSLTINLVFGSTANRDRLQIGGIEVRPNTTGAGSGILSVAVTAGTANGLAGQDMADLSIAPTPGFSLVSASPNPVCENNLLTLSSTATGGSGSYSSYAWNGPNGYSVTSGSSGATIPSVSILGDGVYSVTVTDNNGCKGMGTTAFVTVNGNPSITVASGSPNPICVGATLTLLSTATGGSNAYTTYTWNGPGYTFSSGSSTATETNIATGNAGVYSVTVTDNNGCKGTGVTSSITVSTNPIVNSATATPNPLCVGSMLTLNSIVTAGTGAISSYAWNGPSFTASTQNTSIPSVTTANTGTYSMTVTDVNGCKATGNTGVVTVNTNPVVNSATATPNPICVGSMLSLSSNLSAGSGAINSYTWHGPNSFFANTQNSSIASVTTFAAGVYSVTVGDANGCSASGTTSSVVVNTNPTITAGAVPNPICAGNTLSLTSAPSGGSGSYPTYSWNGPGGFSAAIQNPSNFNIASTGAGVYSVTVTDGNGCTANATTVSVVVDDNPTITVFANPNPICAANTLSLTSTPAGGSGTYSSFAWTGPNTFFASTQNTSITNITTAADGIYSVTVTDNNGCKGYGTTTTILVNTNPTITAGASPNPICVGNTLTLTSTPSGGSGAYANYAWNGPGFSFSSASSGTTETNIATANEGIYSVTVTDNNGCSGSATTSAVIVNTNPVITATVTPNPVCVGNMVNLNATVAGGSGVYTSYAWNGPNTFSAGTQNTFISTISTAADGVYSVTVTDNNGCSASATTSSLVVNTNPTFTSVTATPNPICYGNTLNLNSTPTGGSGTYVTYAWNGPGSFTAATRNTTNPNITASGAGIYTVTVTDNNGCYGMSTTSSVTVNVNPTITASVTPNPICVGNTLSLSSTPTDGSGTYTTFLWNGPSGFVSGLQNTTSSNIATTGAGVYTVTVTDNNGCSATTTTAPVVVNTNPAITATVTPNPICVGGNVNLNATPSGGSGSYVTFAWSGPNTFASSAQNTSISNITTAGAGTYSITVTDNNGCSGSGTSSALVVNTNPTIATAIATPNPICTGNNLSLSSTVTGGSGTYTTYSWSGPGLYTAAGQNATNNAITLAGAGAYSVTVTDNNGCSGSGTTASVVVNPTPGISATATPNPICATNTLSLNSTPSGGSGTYAAFAWNGPDSYSTNTQNASILNIDLVNAGTYSVTVTDNDGCSASATTAPVVVNALPIAYIVTGGGSYCFGTGGVHIGLSNSETGVNYQLLFGATVVATASGTTGDAIDFGLFTAAGSPYTVVATNASSCTNNMSGSVAITILPLPGSFDVTGGGSYCLNGSGVVVGLDGSATGVNYQLYNGGSTVGSTVAGTGSALNFGFQTTAGTYTVLATDPVTTCTLVMNNNAIVSTLPLPLVHNIAGGGTMCSTGVGFHIGMDGSEIGINYQLYNGSSAVGTPFAGNGGGIDFGIYTAAGTYSVSATNTSTGCMNAMAGSATIIVNPVPVVFTISGGGAYCIGDTGVHIGLTGSEVNIDYQLYLGSAAAGSPVHGTGSALDFGLQLAAGTYSVSATNTLTGCTSNMASSTVIVINTLPNVYAVTGGGNYCLGGTGADVSLSGSDLGVNYQTILGGVPFGSSVPGTGAVGTFDIGLETTTGTYSVVATNPLTGCTSNMTGDATVGTYALPNIYNVSGGGAYCIGGAGEDVDIDNTDANTNYQVYSGSAAVGAPVLSAGGAMSFGPYMAAGTYTVQATDNATGCINNMNGSATIVVNPLPDAITGGPSVCTGSVTAYTDDSTGGAWSSFDPTIATIDAATGIITGVAAGSTTITYTLPTTCSVTASILVNQTPDNITGINSVCVGAVNTLSDDFPGGTWSNTNVAVATTNAATGDVYGVSGGTDLITYSMPTGCFITVLETVNALPVLPAISSSSPLGVCEGQVVTYTDGTTGGTWSSDNTGIATINAATGDVTGITTGSANITYTYTDGFGCTNNTSLGVTVNPLPGVSIITGAADVCEGASITLSDATAGGTWNSSTVNATINSMGVVTGVTFGSAIISYTVTNGFGCSATTVYALAVGNAMPASAILPVGSATLCGGSAVALSVASTDLSSITSFQWLLAGGNIAGADSVSYMADSAGLYSVMIGNGTCEVTLAATNVVNPPNPVIVFDSVGNDLTTGSFATYQWYFNDSVIAGANSSLITSMGDGTYMVVVSDGNGCSDTATYTIGTTGIANTQNIAKNIKIYPNPATSVLYIDAPGKVFVTVLSPDGKVVMDRREAVSLNVGQLADGVYVIMIYDNNNNLVKTDKFVKMQ